MYKSQTDTHEFLASRTAEGLKLDPRTAIVGWEYRSTLDPYGIYDLPKEWTQIGRQYFARASNSEIWVSFYHLPNETRDDLWGRYCEEASRDQQTYTTQINPHGSCRGI